MYLNYCLLRCQLLTLANNIENKEYPADWLKGGKSIFRQGGRFSSNKSSNDPKEILGKLGKKLGTIASVLQKDISDAPSQTKKAIANFFGSKVFGKITDELANGLDEASSGAGKTFKTLIDYPVKLFTENKPLEAIAKLSTDIDNATTLGAVAAEGIIAAGGLIFGVPLIVDAALGAGLATLGVRVVHDNFNLQNALQVGGLYKGLSAIEQGKKIEKIITEFAKSGASQLSYDAGALTTFLGCNLIISSSSILTAEASNALAIATAALLIL